MKLVEWFEGVFNSLGDKIRSPFDVITIFLEERLELKVIGAVEQVLENFEHEMKIPLKPVLDEALKNPALPPDIRQLIEEAREPEHFATSTLLAAAAAISIMPALSASSSGGIQQIRQESMKLFKPSLLSIDEVIAGEWRGINPSFDYKGQLDQWGYSADKQAIIEGVRRYIPNASDLIRFTVRDVFNPDVVTDYGYDVGFEEATKPIQKHIDAIGMDKEILKLYWRAHWALPSITQGFEMMHRTDFTEGDMAKLLKIADVAPYYIPKLLEISYAPYTRVDIRRMHDVGILDPEAVKTAYKDIGYDEEHAENLTEWTIAATMSAEKDLSKAEILTAYVQGAIPVNEAETSLTDMGYDVDEAKLIIAIQDYKMESKILIREKKILINRFARGDLIVEELKQALGALGLSEREITITIEEAHTKVKEKIATPTKADLLKWMDKGIISSEVFMADMRLKGYSQAHIENYIEAAV